MYQFKLRKNCKQNWVVEMFKNGVLVRTLSFNSMCEAIEWIDSNRRFDLFERKLMWHLKELQQLYRKMMPIEAGMLSIGVDRDYYNAFILNRDGNYLINITHLE